MGQHRSRRCGPWCRVRTHGFNRSEEPTDQGFVGHIHGHRLSPDAETAASRDHVLIVAVANADIPSGPGQLT